jgi:polyhydroxyalkanoate synthesis regulator phasin
MTSLNSSPSTTTPLLQTQNLVLNNQIQQLTEQVQQLTEHNNQLNEQISPKWWKSTRANVAYAFLLITGTATLMNQFIITPIKETSDNKKEKIDQLEKEVTKLKGDPKQEKTLTKGTEGQSQNTKLDLTTLGTNRVYYNFANNNNTVGSGFILSDSARSQLKSFQPQTITVNISFESGQKLFNVYVKDANNNSSDPIEFKKSAGAGLSSERKNERSLVIPIKNLSKIDQNSIAEIVVEGHQLKNSSPFFTLKNILIE